MNRNQFQQAHLFLVFLYCTTTSLLKGTSNLSVWEKAIPLHLGVRYDRTADFIVTGARYVPPGIAPAPTDAFKAA